MSRVECDHCGARYELQREAGVVDQAGPGPTATCRECGAPARMTFNDHSSPTPLAASPDTPSALAIDEESQQEEPPTARSPVTILEDALDDEKTVALLVTTAAAAAEQGKAADAKQGETANSAAEPAPAAPGNDDAEEEVPNSLTPSMEALIRRVRPESTSSEARKNAFSLESLEYDFRPPDIQVEPRPTESVRPAAAPAAMKTDAPVAGTHRPPPAGKPSNRSGVVIGLLLSAGAIFLTARAMKTEDAPAAPAAPPTLEEVTRSATDESQKPSAPPAIGEATPAPASTTVIADAPATALAPPEAPPVAPAAPRPATNNKALSTVTRAPRGGAVIPASLTTERSDPAEKVEPTRVPADTPFDSSAASLALDSAASQASSCRKGDDPSGSATVTITFSPSGRVTTATISGPPFAGTETGSCIASRLRGTRVPAFSGDFITVKKTVTIQ